MKTSIKVISIGVIIAMTQSCSIFKKIENQAEDMTSMTKGNYMYGSEVSSFQPCDSESEFWVVGDEGITTELQNDYLEMVNKPYEQVFVSFRGYQLEKANECFAADYDGQFKVTEVISLQKDDICQ
ncbi:hypothetical protein GCM10009123_04670 [Kangiella japonica]|uniref:NlpE C-terminal OB domain-containing protein n=1 Tax=Kangiella japonica TaxID=647384 RepID=A0ABP3CDV6_9GAMM